MKESYCIKDKRVTPCVEPSGYQKDRLGRTQFFCRCGVCGNKKVRYIKTESTSQTVINPFKFIFNKIRSNINILYKH